MFTHANKKPFVFLLHVYVINRSNVECRQIFFNYKITTNQRLKNREYGNYEDEFDKKNVTSLLRATK